MTTSLNKYYYYYYYRQIHLGQGSSCAYRMCMAEELLAGQRHPSIQGRAIYRLGVSWPPLLRLSHPREARYWWDYVLNMDQSNSSTRVPAPDKSTTANDCLATIHSRHYDDCAPKPPDAHSPMRAGSSAVTSQSHLTWDLRHSTRIATWNVSTLHRSGHYVTVVHELARLNVVIARLTETRLLQHGSKDVEDTLLLHSGGDSHLHGVTLVLRKKAKKSLCLVDTHFAMPTACQDETSPWTLVNYCGICTNRGRTRYRQGPILQPAGLTDGQHPFT